MLVWFPNFREDELFHSAVARYADVVRSPSPSKDGAFQDVFGPSTDSVSAYLPHNLQHFLENLPGKTSHTLESLIDSHTVFPFHCPFLSLERAQKIKQEIGYSGSFPLSRLGRGARNPSKHLRYCPICVLEDCERYGETYWHRTHQLPGVEVCPIHGCWLDNSDVPMREKGSTVCTSAKNAVQALEPRLLEPNNRVHQLLLEIAKEASWLLRNPGIIQDNTIFQNFYYSILFERGLLLKDGRIANRQKLLGNFREFCPGELLSLSGCEIVSEDKNWIIQIMAKGGSTAPIHHLIFMRFLHHTFEDLLTVRPPFVPKPFGDGPWPCFNHICPNYKKICIHECQVTEVPKGRNGDGHYIGVFKCQCGFTYERNSLSTSSSEFKQATKIIAYGDLWDTEFVAMWTNPEVTVNQLVMRFGRSVSKIIDIAHCLGLDLTKYKGIQSPSSSKIVTASQKNVSWTEKRDRFRTELLQAKTENRGLSSTELKQLLPSTFAWLERYDLEWVRGNRGAFKTRRSKKVGKDYWVQRDTDCVNSLYEAAERIKNLPSKPQWLTKDKLLSGAGCRSIVKKHPDRIPIAMKAIEELVETKLEFALRRIAYFVQLYKESGTRIQRGRFMTKASLYPYRDHPAIQKAIDRAMMILNS